MQSHKSSSPVKAYSKIILTLGIILMAYGVINTGVVYREMRKERVLHEPISIMKLDLSNKMRWETSYVPIYREGNHVIYFTISETKTDSVKMIDQIHEQFSFGGELRLVVENPAGEVIKEARLPQNSLAIIRPDHMLWVIIDTLHITHVLPGELKIQVQMAEPDKKYFGRIAELLITPPHAAEFAPYVQRKSSELYGMGIFILAGFSTIVIGGYLSRR